MRALHAGGHGMRPARLIQPATPANRQRTVDGGTPRRRDPVFPLGVYFSLPDIILGSYLCCRSSNKAQISFLREAQISFLRDSQQLLKNETPKPRSRSRINPHLHDDIINFFHFKFSHQVIAQPRREYIDVAKNWNLESSDKADSLVERGSLLVPPFYTTGGSSYDAPVV